MMTNETQETLHIRFDGRSEETNLAALDLTRQSTDTQIMARVAAYLDRPVSAFSRYVIVRTSTAVIVRPEAVYG